MIHYGFRKCNPKDILVNDNDNVSAEDFNYQCMVETRWKVESCNFINNFYPLFKQGILFSANSRRNNELFRQNVDVLEATN